MKKRVIKITIIAIFIVALLMIEIQWVNGQTEEIEYTAVWSLNANKSKDDEIIESDLTLLYIDKNRLISDYCLEDEKGKVIGQKLLINFSEKTPLLKTAIEEKNKRYELDKSKSMTAFKLLPEQALCFQMEPGEKIQLMIVDSRREFDKESPRYTITEEGTQLEKREIVNIDDNKEQVIYSDNSIINNGHNQVSTLSRKVIGIYDQLEIVEVYNSDMIPYKYGDEALPMYVIISGHSRDIESIIQHKSTCEFELYQSNN